MTKEQLDAVIEAVKKNLVWNDPIKNQIPKEATEFWKTIFLALMNDRERFDASGREIVSIDALRELIKADKEGRVIPKLDCSKCGNKKNEYLCVSCYARITPEYYSNHWEETDYDRWMREQAEAAAQAEKEKPNE